MLQLLQLSPRQPNIKVTQYMSPDRQMSLPPTSEEPESAADVTVPWLLSPKWSGNELAGSRKRFTKPPKEALKELFNLHLLLQSEFYYPSLRFKDGEPMMTESYAETQYYLMKLQGLLDEVEALKISEQDDADRAKLVDRVQRDITRVNQWIEQERAKGRSLKSNWNSW
ncbi:hypothetical protein OPQ81_004043 [Rhizoctonia solani]|nr:hypothetical protein OPQ81_004043 [Rhizoctonia solani]